MQHWHRQLPLLTHSPLLSSFEAARAINADLWISSGRSASLVLHNQSTLILFFSLNLLQVFPKAYWIHPFCPRKCFFPLAVLGCAEVYFPKLMYTSLTSLKKQILNCVLETKVFFYRPANHHFCHSIRTPKNWILFFFFCLIFLFVYRSPQWLTISF